jgi:two-component system chemotaxis response regulator CheY
MNRILVIDDDGIVREALKEFLGRNGFEVFSSPDGLNGIILLKNIRPDLIILDREMPNLTGSQILKKIREFSKSIPVIILTGYDSMEDKEEYMKNGANSFLSKANGLKPVLEEIKGILKLDMIKNKTFNAENKFEKEEIKKKILIADDDENIRNMLKKFIISINMIPIEAKDGAEAIERYSAEKPDLVLLDIAMPYKNGIEVLKHIYGNDRNANVIMITGNDEEYIAKESLKLGAFDYISKPINLKNLEISIKTRLLIS